MLSGKMEEAKKDEAQTPRIFSLNVCCFPPICGMHILKRKILNPNLIRAKAIAEHILKNNYDVVLLEEVWDPAVASYFQEVLGDKYKQGMRGIKGDNKFCVRGGLMLFSAFEVVEAYAASFPQPMCFEEFIGQKGLQFIKLKINKTEFITVIHTHLHSDSVGCESLLSCISWLFCLGGMNDRDRRDMQMTILADYIKLHAKVSPTDSNLKYAGAYLAGDFNVPLDTLAKMLSLNDKDKIICVGQNKLFSQFVFNKPVNLNSSDTKHDSSVNSSETFAGSFMETADSKLQPPSILYDAIVSDTQALATELVLLRDSEGAPVSDHLALRTTRQAAWFNLFPAEQPTLAQLPSTPVMNRVANANAK